MKMFSDEERRPHIIWALLTFILPIIVILIGTVVIGLRPPVLPIIFAIVLSAIMCLITGYKWQELQDGMFEALSRVHIAIAILVMVGMLISSWVASGTIPAIIYWGLKIISPAHFPVSCLVLCAITAVATGTSTATIGTLGVALLGIGSALGYPVGMTAGAVLSGAYFGDKMSPISDTTNIAASVAEVPLFQHIAAMLWTTVPALIVAFVMYIVMGQLVSADLTASMDNINTILSTLEKNYSLSWYAFIPPVVMIVLAYMRFPVLPVMMASLAVAIALCFMEGSTVKEVGTMLTTGFKSTTGVKQVDSLLSRGGIMSVMATIVLLCSGVAFGGILEKAKVLDVVIGALLKGAKGSFRLISSSVLAGLIINIGTGAQLLAVIVPGRSFAKPYKDANIHASVLSRSSEDTGTLACPLVPWSVHAFMIFGMTGVTAYEYAPYAFLNWLCPLFAFICAATGFGVWHRDGSPMRGKGKGIEPEEKWLKEQKDAKAQAK